MEDRKEQHCIESEIAPSKEYTLNSFYELC